MRKGTIHLITEEKLHIKNKHCFSAASAVTQLHSHSTGIISALRKISVFFKQFTTFFHSTQQSLCHLTNWSESFHHLSYLPEIFILKEASFSVCTWHVLIRVSAVRAAIETNCELFSKYKYCMHQTFCLLTGF